LPLNSLPSSSSLPSFEHLSSFLVTINNYLCLYSRNFKVTK